MDRQIDGWMLCIIIYHGDLSPALGNWPPETVGETTERYYQNQNEHSRENKWFLLGRFVKMSLYVFKKLAADGLLQPVLQSAPRHSRSLHTLFTNSASCFSSLPNGCAFLGGTKRKQHDKPNRSLESLIQSCNQERINKRYSQTLPRNQRCRCLPQAQSCFRLFQKKKHHVTSFHFHFFTSPI